MKDKLSNLSERKKAVRNLVSMVNNHSLLDLIAKNSYKRGDISASWMGPFVPESNETSYVSFNKISAIALATWARSHWMIYESFIDEFCSKDGNVLDVGCGSGNTSALLSVIFPQNRIIAIDSDNKTIKFAKKFNQHPNIDYIHSSLEKLSSTKFDYVFACEVLEHMDYDKQFSFIEKCLDFLEEDGLLFITTPNSINEKVGGHHVGLLNEKEFLNFYEKFSNKLHHFSFIDNKKLEICDKGVDAVIYESYEFFNKGDKNRSHFRMVLKNNFISQKL